VSQARRIGPFALAEVMGHGHGTVLYRATRAEGSRPPKEVCIRLARDPLDTTVAAAIRHEYNILRAMDNPRIPKAYGHYSDESAVAMSHFEGVPLQSVLEAQKTGSVDIAAGTAIDIVVEVAHALRHASSVIDSNGNRIVHGHLTPSQIRLSPDGNVMVVGFGTVPAEAQLAYMAPEVSRGERATPQSDQWSLASILIELITSDALYTHVGDPRDASAVGDVHHWILQAVELHPELEVALKTMLSFNPSDRFVYGHELLKTLLAAGRQIGGTVNRRSLLTQVTKSTSPPPEMTVKSPNTAPIEAFVEPDLTDRSFGSFADLDPPAQAEQVMPTFSEPFGFPPMAHEPSGILPVDSTAPPAPDPVPILLPSEFAGMALGGLMVLLGLTYVFWIL